MKKIKNLLILKTALLLSAFYFSSCESEQLISSDNELVENNKLEYLIAEDNGEKTLLENIPYLYEITGENPEYAEKDIDYPNSKSINRSQLDTNRPEATRITVTFNRRVRDGRVRQVFRLLMRQNKVLRVYRPGFRVLKGKNANTYHFYAYFSESYRRVYNTIRSRFNGCGFRSIKYKKRNERKYFNMSRATIKGKRRGGRRMVMNKVSRSKKGGRVVIPQRGRILFQLWEELANGHTLERHWNKGTQYLLDRGRQWATTFHPDYINSEDFTALIKSTVNQYRKELIEQGKLTLQRAQSGSKFDKVFEVPHFLWKKGVRNVGYGINSNSPNTIEILHKFKCVVKVVTKGPAGADQCPDIDIALVTAFPVK